MFHVDTCFQFKNILSQRTDKGLWCLHQLKFSGLLGLGLKAGCSLADISMVFMAVIFNASTSSCQ